MSATVQLMRFTFVDRVGSVSLVGPCALLEALVAACATQPASLDELLDAVTPFNDSFPDTVHSGLAVFDEHNSPTNYERILAAIEYFKPIEMPIFRVVDPRTRELALSPVGAGVVVFNLLDKRIVQIQNTYGEIRRRGRVRMTVNGKPTNRVRRYELPRDWSLVPGGSQ